MTPLKHTRRLLPVAALGLLPALGGCLAEGFDASEGDDANDIVVRQAAYTALNPGEVRRSIHDLDSASRFMLANDTLNFITQAVIDEHRNATGWHTNTEVFFTGHHGYVNQLEAYLLSIGHTSLVPVPRWDPATPIPSQFNVASSLVSQSPMNLNPNMPLSPAELLATDKCPYTTGDSLATAMRSPWHNDVHNTISGAMGNPMIAPGAPIFWLFHGFIDDYYHQWDWRCRVLPGVLVAAAS
jgi:hypothetical protein